VAIYHHGLKKTFVETTDITFQTLSSEVIQAYIATQEPFDKAGGFGIQGQGALLISHINGDFYNALGLPLGTLGRWLYYQGFHVFSS
jgi:septum formation protein